MQTATLVSPKVLANVGSSLAAIGAYTPATAAVINHLSLANKSGATVNVNVTMYNGSTDYYINFNTPILAGDTLILTRNGTLTLVNGWNVRVSCPTASAVDAVMIVTEYT